MPPARLLFGVTFLPEDFPQRLERFKKASGLTWDGLAACLGIDPRQLQRWRKGTKPSGDGLFALILLAARVPGGVHTLLGTLVAPPIGTRRTAPVDGPGLDEDPPSASSPPTLPDGDGPRDRRSRCNPNTGGAETRSSARLTGDGCDSPSRRIFRRGYGGSRSCRASRGRGLRSGSE